MEWNTSKHNVKQLCKGATGYMCILQHKIINIFYGISPGDWIQNLRHLHHTVRRIFQVHMLNRETLRWDTAVSVLLLIKWWNHNRMWNLKPASEWMSDCKSQSEFDTSAGQLKGQTLRDRMTARTQGISAKGHLENHMLTKNPNRNLTWIQNTITDQWWSNFPSTTMMLQCKSLTSRAHVQ